MSVGEENHADGSLRPFIIDIPEPEGSVVVDIVDEKFLVFDPEAKTLLSTSLRMIGNEVFPGGPVMLSPEQVSVLLQYGKARVRRVRSDPPLDNSCFEPSTSKNERDPPPFQDDYEKARQIAIGRKAKELKRKAVGPGANARALKIKRTDLAAVKVSDEDVITVLKELGKQEETEDQGIFLAMTSSNEDFYEDVEFFNVPLPSTSEFRMKELVFHDLWRRGYYLTIGLKFGADYLAYDGNPNDVHAEFIVHCMSSDETISPLKMITLTRLATQVKKKVLLATVSPDNHIPHYMTLQWFRPY